VKLPLLIFRCELLHRSNIDIIDIRHLVDISDYISATAVAEIFIKLKE